MLDTKNIKIKSFDQLTKKELYAILALRIQVFCVEQNCPYQDIDYQDIDATHVFLKDADSIMAYARIIHENENKAHIGRVVVNDNYRKHGYATLIMQNCIQLIKQNKTKNIIISAQSYLKDFYRNLGFVNTGKYYLEDDIPHEQMQIILTS